VTSALLITAALGAMVLAHRERTSPKPTQRDLSRIRVASGDPAPLPGPGTYARHNGADMPALLPDGTPAATSVSPYISQRIEPPAVTAGPPGGQISPAAADSPGPDGEPPALAGSEAAGRPARPAQEGDPS
jgi:NADH-quinone oxidoreductase subunit J